jgi:hypothetical protein
MMVIPAASGLDFDQICAVLLASLASCPEQQSLLCPNTMRAFSHPKDTVSQIIHGVFTHIHLKIHPTVSKNLPYPRLVWVKIHSRTNGMPGSNGGTRQ